MQADQKAVSNILRFLYTGQDLTAALRQHVFIHVYLHSVRAHRLYSAYRVCPSFKTDVQLNLILINTNLFRYEACPHLSILVRILGLMQGHFHILILYLFDFFPVRFPHSSVPSWIHQLSAA